MVGQTALLGQLRMVVAGTKLRGTPMPHVLLAGPAGHGKTTLAGIVAHELGAALVETTGMMLRRPADLVGLLMKVSGPTVLFIDEIHSLPRPVIEVLYEVLEDSKLSTLMGSGSETVAYTHQMRDLVCVGATTRPGLLTEPFRQRFGYHGTVDAYSTDELTEIVRRAWVRVGVEHGAGEPREVALRCKGVPRRALHLAERVLDYCAVYDCVNVFEGITATALSVFGIDQDGLDEQDFRILAALVEAGRTVGVDALAQMIDMDPKTLQDEYEPYLVRAGLVLRAKSGRMASPDAHKLMKHAA
jgi:Holliday junction DNA helicase RuvB